MTESNDKDLKKVHLIKQPRQETPEQPQELPAQNPLDQGAEKKKVVVVVKKKIVTTKKVQAKAMIPEAHEDQKMREKQSTLSAQPLSEAGKTTTQIRTEDKAVSPSSTAPSTTTLSSSKSASTAPSQKSFEHKQEIRQDETIISSQRRYSSDGRAGNLAQGRPSSTYRNGHERGESRPASGSYQGRAHGQPSGRSYPSTSSRSGQFGSQQFSRGSRPSGGSQNLSGTGSSGRAAYPYAKTGQPGGAQRSGGYTGARQSPAGGRYGLRQTPAPIPSTENERPASRRAPAKKKGVFNKREEETELEKQIQLKKKAEAKLAAVPKSIDIMENISISELAKKMNLKPADLISKLMSLGVMATINQKIDADTAAILAAEYSCEVKVVSLYDETVIEKAADKPEELKPRPPIVTVMGHVDHGKTKLLDAIRKTDVVSQEFGGITQHIGAYMVEAPNGKISFLDTPGHAAFTKMRARGANITDIVVLVVSATEGVMTQTKEAIDHAKAANVPIIVAINKIDLPEANPDRVKTQLSELGLIPEEWGGQTQFVEVSALQKIGIPELFDAILIQAEMLDLKANYDRLADGKIIESLIDQGRGIVATIMVQNGTLHIGDPFVAGIFPGRVRAMFDDKGNRIELATPSMPVEVIGFEGMPEAGDPFEVVEDEKFARQISAKRQELKKYEEGR
ncbi:MAG TPA: translation initiation factor IF-2, partial [Rectinema sp.]|nr:translation initiation factor IF-2 [Rectinema sp.]